MHVPIIERATLSVPELWMTQSDHIIYHHMQRSLRMRRVTWPITDGKNDPRPCL